MIITPKARTEEEFFSRFQERVSMEKMRLMAMGGRERFIGSRKGSRFCLMKLEPETLRPPAQRHFRGELFRDEAGLHIRGRFCYPPLYWLVLGAFVLLAAVWFLPGVYRMDPGLLLLFVPVLAGMLLLVCIVMLLLGRKYEKEAIALLREL